MQPDQCHKETLSGDTSVRRHLLYILLAQGSPWPSDGPSSVSHMPDQAGNISHHYMLGKHQRTYFVHPPDAGLVRQIESWISPGVPHPRCLSQAQGWWPRVWTRVWAWWWPHWRDAKAATAAAAAGQRTAWLRASSSRLAVQAW